jgi:hypothetical protein
MRVHWLLPLLFANAIVGMLSSYITVGSTCGYPISASNEQAHIISFVTVNAAISSAIVDESAVTVCYLLRVKKLPERRPIWSVQPARM